MAAKPKKIKVKSFEQACEIQGLDPNDLPIVSHLPERHHAYFIDQYKLIIIIEAQNKVDEDWKVKWDDGSQPKYFPWPEVIKNKSKSGFGLSLDAVSYSFSSSAVGSRLYIGDRGEAERIFKKFKTYYESFHLYK